MIDIQSFCMHTIDIENKIFSRKSFAVEKEDFNTYLNTLIEEILDTEKGRSYEFVSDTEEVANCLRMIVDGSDWEKHSESIASKLNRCEIDKQEKVRGISSLKKGNLIQVIGLREGKYICVLTKVENDPYLDEDNLKLSSGLPVKKNRVQKSCYIEYGEDKKVKKIILSDSNAKIADYWWSNFLATKPEIPSIENTKKAYLAIDDLLKRTIKKKSVTDYWYMRNELNSYFGNQEAFVFDEVVERLSSYKTENNDVLEIMPDFVKTLKELPKKNKFDTQFDLDTKEIKARLRRRIILDAHIELRITGGVEDIDNKIDPGQDEKGKFIKIYSEEGYKEFYRSKEEQVP